MSIEYPHDMFESDYLKELTSLLVDFIKTYDPKLTSKEI